MSKTCSRSVAPSARDIALLEEMSFVRRAAQTEADLTYEDWRRRLCRDSYAVYRAAQDRADAAQDDLADIAILQVQRSENPLAL